jgi:hypothetical protein
MARSARRRRPADRRAGRPALAGLACLLGLVLLARCATTTPTAPEPARSHVYPLPLDNVLTQSAAALAKKGWRVQRVGNVIVTNWLGSSETIVAYRVFGQSVDVGYCTLRVERIVATSSTVYYEGRTSGHRPTLGGTEVPLPEEFQGGSDVYGRGGQDKSANGIAAGMTVPFGMEVSQHTRDTALEREFQELIDPLAATAAKAEAVPAAARLAEAVADAGVSVFPEVATLPPASSNPEQAVTARPAAETVRSLAALGGIWSGTFTFSGNVVGTFSGEVVVAVDGQMAEFSDFCPERGGPLTANGSGDFAAWQGSLVCPPISLRGCTNTVVTYNYATAAVSEDTLTVVASGNVDAPAGCINSVGPISVVFAAHRADYVHIAVNRTKGKTACVWPSDWEDLASTGSMAMPEEPMDPLAYLGIIRTRGDRLPEIQRLLRHCRHLVLLHGRPVQMRLAATRTAER